MLDKLIKKKITDQFDIEDANGFFRQDNLTTFLTANVAPIGKLFKKMAEIASSLNSELKEVLHPNSMALAGTFLTKVGELLTNDVHNAHFGDFCNKLER